MKDFSHSSFIQSVSWGTSYEPIWKGNPKVQKKPDWIKTLDLDDISIYRAYSTDQNSDSEKMQSYAKENKHASRKSIQDFGNLGPKNGVNHKMPSIILPQFEFEVDISGDD